MRPLTKGVPSEKNPLITLVGVLCFAALSIFTLQRATAERGGNQQSPQSIQQPSQTAGTLTPKPSQTIVGDDGAVSTAPDEVGKDFVPGEILVKFRSESDAIDAGRGLKTAGGHLRVSNRRLNDLFARFSIRNGHRPFANAKLRSLGKVVKLTAGDKQSREERV